MKPSSLLPKYYDGIVEFNALMECEDMLYEMFAQSIQEAEANMNISTSTEPGLCKWELFYKIDVSPIDTLEFRKERVLNRFRISPPFTWRFLQERLNDIIGTGKWIAYMDYNNYTLYVETIIQTQGWFVELTYTLNTIKPCNIVFINVPRINSKILISEQISKGNWLYHYRLDQWRLGEKPFSEITKYEVAKMSNIKSLQLGMFSGVAASLKQLITKVSLNGIIIDNWAMQETDRNKYTLEYKVYATTFPLSEITNIQLLDNSDTILSDIDVYIPVVSDIQVKHQFIISEG